MNTENKIYTVTDFTNYHKGNMPFAEMHALEKAALNNPFLADALEGYAVTQTGENDVLLLKKRISDYNGKAKTFSSSSFLQSKWLRIAALLIVILGVGYFYYNNYNDSKTTLAENKIFKTDTLQIAAAETTTFISDNKTETASDNTIAAVNENEIKPIPENVEKIIQRNTKDNAVQLNSTEDIAPATAKQDKVFDEEDKRNLAPAAKQQNNTENNTTYFTQQGNVTDLKGEPLQNASVVVTERKRRIGTLTDKNGNFKLKTTDSSAYVSVSTVGYDSKEVMLNNNNPQKIILNKNEEDLQNVVVTRNSVSQKKRSAIVTASTNTVSMEISGKTDGLTVQTQKVSSSSEKKRNDKSKKESINNTATFNEYIKNNIIPLFDENNKPLKGKVALFFDVDKFGKPQNIAIISSGCEGCNEQAIILLKNGPSWLSKILHSNRVIIEF